MSRNLAITFICYHNLTTIALQIPKDMNEELLLPFFSEFGPVAELTVIRDKVNQSHKGGRPYLKTLTLSTLCIDNVFDFFVTQVVHF